MKVIPYTKFEDFGIILLSYTAYTHIQYYRERERERERDADERFTPATVVGVSKNCLR